jgi:hypothetical protein
VACKGAPEAFVKLDQKPLAIFTNVVQLDMPKGHTLIRDTSRHLPAFAILSRLSTKTTEPDNEICEVEHAVQEYMTNCKSEEIVLKTAVEFKHCIRNFVKDDATVVLKEIRELDESSCGAT